MHFSMLVTESGFLSWLGIDSVEGVRLFLVAEIEQTGAMKRGLTARSLVVLASGEIKQILTLNGTIKLIGRLQAGALRLPPLEW